MCFIPALALIGAVACLPKLLWEELNNIELQQCLSIAVMYVVMGTQPVRACSVSTAMRFTQVVQTWNGNFILTHTLCTY